MLCEKIDDGKYIIDFTSDEVLVLRAICHKWDVREDTFLKRIITAMLKVLYNLIYPSKQI